MHTESSRLKYAGMGDRIEAKAFQGTIWFDGCEAFMRIRVFLQGGKVVGVRSFRLHEPARNPEEICGPPLRRYDEGVIHLNDVEYCGDPAPGPYSGT